MKYRVHKLEVKRDTAQVVLQAFLNDLGVVIKHFKDGVEDVGEKAGMIR